MGKTISLSVRNLKPFSWLATVIVAILASCASPQPLTGGVKDTKPPAILEASSTPNKQIHFTEKQIILTFDEWVVLKDVDAQLVVSPLMSKKPEIKQKGKAIIITLPDSLKERTTYSMNFGSAIQDLNENNKLENYSFIFSTGDYLDSIEVKGKVRDAVTLKPSPDIVVMLYPIADDSLVYKQKPEYLAKTNKEGAWSISNIRIDSFRVVALKDENLNFIYDQDAELFGWLDMLLYTNSSKTLPDIVVSPRNKKTIIQDINAIAPGWIKMYIPNHALTNYPIFNPQLENQTFEWVGDSLFIWYPPDQNYAGKAILGTDTTRITASHGMSMSNKKIKLSGLSGRLYPYDDFRIKADVPISKIENRLITLEKDTVRNIPLTVVLDSASQRVINVRANWIPASRYRVKFAKGALTDIWGRTNDTFNLSFVVNGLDQFSNLDMQFSGLDSTYDYVVLIKMGEHIDRTFYIHHQANASISTKGLTPGKYTIEVIEDQNANGRWDTGDYHLKRQPEQRQIFVPENLRAGWDVEFSMNWNQLPGSTDKEVKDRQ